MDRDNTTKWCADLLKENDRYVVTSNGQYELEGISSLGINPRGRIIDVQVAEALIDEEQESYSHDSLCTRWLGKLKDETLLREAAACYNVDPKSGLWKLPSWYVGPYAEFDAQSNLLVFEKQLIKLKEENLLPIFELESKLLRLLWEMRKRGIPVDIDGAEKLSAELKLKEKELKDRLFHEAGFPVDVQSSDSIEALCKARNISYPTTDKGNASFTKEWLEAFSDPTIQLISKVREVTKMRRDFVDGWVIENQCKGYVHPVWRQLASDDGGTRTGRMACSNPNAQQIPAGKYRMTGDPNPYGKKIRSLFRNPDGKWGKWDYKQQEPRILTHFSFLCKHAGAEDAVKKYRDDKEMDFYQYMVQIAGIDRRPAKDIYLGLCYGMGTTKMAKKLGKSKDEAKAFLAEFNAKLPFVVKMQEDCESSAQRRGYIKTLLGRRRHFNYWEPADRWTRSQEGEYIKPLREEEARKKWPSARLVRADTRKALNALIQGSAADMTKAAIVALHEQIGWLPYMQVHDELDGPVESDEQAEKITHIIENCVDMSVPVYSDMSLGKSWK